MDGAAEKRGGESGASGASGVEKTGGGSGTGVRNQHYACGETGVGGGDSAWFDADDSGSALSGGGEELEEAVEGDGEPGGAMVEFVGDFVEGFFEEKGVEEPGEVVG